MGKHFENNLVEAANSNMYNKFESLLQDRMGRDRRTSCSPCCVISCIYWRCRWRDNVFASLLHYFPMFVLRTTRYPKNP